MSRDFSVDLVRKSRKKWDAPIAKFRSQETTKLTFIPLDENNYKLGGKITGSSLEFNWKSFTMESKKFYGVYSEDFIQFGTFEGEQDPLENEELLMEITKDESEAVKERFTFRYEDDRVFFSYDTNSTEPEDASNIAENELIPETRTYWSEKLFYGLGNSTI